MSREFKFRVWDKKKNKWLDPNKYAPHLINFNGIILKSPGPYSNLENININHLEYTEIFNQDRFVIQQYTSIKDFYGKEIYEGDVVKYDWVWEPNDEEFKEQHKCSEVKFICSNNGVGFLFLSDDDDTCENKFFIPPNIKVIGNIFENPELLNN